MVTKKGISFLVFFFAIFIAFTAGKYKERNETERLRFNFELPLKKEVVQVIDIAKQGKMKNLLQPNVISINALGKLQTKHDKIYATFSGVEHYISQGSKKSVWTKLTSSDNVKTNKRGQIPINIEVKIPNNCMRNYKIAEAYLSFSDDVSDIGKIKIIIVDSRYKGEDL